MYIPTVHLFPYASTLVHNVSANDAYTDDCMRLCLHPSSIVHPLESRSLPSHLCKSCNSLCESCLHLYNSSRYASWLLDSRASCSYSIINLFASRNCTVFQRIFNWVDISIAQIASFRFFSTFSKISKLSSPKLLPFALCTVSAVIHRNIFKDFLNFCTICNFP